MGFLFGIPRSSEVAGYLKETFLTLGVRWNVVGGFSHIYYLFLCNLMIDVSVHLQLLEAQGVMNGI